MRSDDAVMRWRYVAFVGGIAAVWLAWDLYWTWQEDHQALDQPPGLEWPDDWRDTDV